MKFSFSEAQFELALLNAKAQEYERIDAFATFINAGMPLEIIARMEKLWEKTLMFGKKIISIGKIIIIEIVRFIKENQNLAVGMALGAAIGALINLIPFLGPILTPISVAISGVIGGVAGYRIDQDVKNKNGFMGIAQEVIIVARKFFEMIALILNSVIENKQI